MSTMANVTGSMVRQSAVLTVLVCYVLLGGCRSAISHGDADLPNFQQVTSTLYRGGQPTHEGMVRLHDMGVKTILNVRGGDTDRDLLLGLGFVYLHRPMSAFSPSDEDVAWFLRIATDPDRAPVFLHCHHGSDRTGYLIAMHRVVVEGWDRQRAIDEMTADGNGFHGLYQGLIRYVRDADVERLRGEVGLTSDASHGDTTQVVSRSDREPSLAKPVD